MDKNILTSATIGLSALALGLFIGSRGKAPIMAATAVRVSKAPANA